MPDSQSDIDVVAILTDGASPEVARTIVRRLRSLAIGQRVECRALRQQALARLASEPSVYGAHLARDAQVLFDRGAEFSKFQKAFPLDRPVSETAGHLRTRFTLYEELGWCNGEYLFCLADLYAIGRSAAMLGLAQKGIFEFDRSRVFPELAAHYPALVAHVATVHELEPFYMFVRRDVGEPEQFPFSPHGSHADAETAREACAAVLAAIK